MARFRVLLVDENDDYLDGLEAWLAKAPGIEVVGRAHSGRDAQDRALRLVPDLVLADVSLPDMSGFELTRCIKAMRPEPIVLLMTFHDSRAVGLAAVAAGATACVAKTAVTEQLLPAITSLLRSRRPAIGALGTPNPSVPATERNELNQKRRRP